MLDHHVQMLADQAVDLQIADLVGVRSAAAEGDLPVGVPDYWASMLPALLYPWTFDGVTAWQIAPDDRDRFKKYLFVDDAQTFMNEVIETWDQGPVLIVEGSKQQLVAASHCEERWSVYGIAGCWNWTSANLSVFEGREVVVIFDGDVATNRDVYDGAVKLRDNLLMYGVGSVQFAILPTTGNDGLDDWLSRAPQSKRAALLQRLVAKAGDLPGKAPKARSAAKSSNPYIDPKEGLLAVDAANAVLEMSPAAITREDRIATYRDGYYSISGAGFAVSVLEILGNQFRKQHEGNIERAAYAMLAAENVLLPEEQSAPVLNVRNGMLDLLTLELHPHDPKWFSTQQIPIEWDPQAVCPEYERWVKQVIPEQVDDFEETASQMLDPSRTPTKALFAYGPSRSGKSTALRLLGAMVGPSNMAAVTLHELVGNRFAAANLYGKMLNSAADLSAAYVEDLSIFKMLTGDDPIQADRKYGGQFTFRNHALFAFSANELPTVGESSRAYSERVRPIWFRRSFAGAEDHAWELAMHGELPGILVRLVAALRRRMDRGGWVEQDTVVRDDFERKSDRIRHWIWDHFDVLDFDALIPEDAPTKREVARMFNLWAKENFAAPMAERKIVERILNMPGVYEGRTESARRRVLNLTLRDEPRSDTELPEGTLEGTNRAHVVEDESASDKGINGVAGSLGSLDQKPMCSAEEAKGESPSAIVGNFSSREGKVCLKLPGTPGTLPSEVGVLNGRKRSKARFKIEIGKS